MCHLYAILSTYNLSYILKNGVLFFFIFLYLFIFCWGVGVHKINVMPQGEGGLAMSDDIVGHDNIVTVKLASNNWQVSSLARTAYPWMEQLIQGSFKCPRILIL